jgi:hypothetical protein
VSWHVAKKYLVTTSYGKNDFFIDQWQHFIYTELMMSVPSAELHYMQAVSNFFRA